MIKCYSFPALVAHIKTIAKKYVLILHNTLFKINPQQLMI